MATQAVFDKVLGSTTAEVCLAYVNLTSRDPFETSTTQIPSLLAAIGGKGVPLYNKRAKLLDFILGHGI